MKCILFGLFFLIQSIACLRFDVHAKVNSEPMCVRDFIQDGQLVVVNIFSSGFVGDGQILSLKIVDSVGNEYRTKKDFAGQLRVAFTAHSTALFDICFDNILVNKNNVAFRELELEIELGSAARDWNAIQLLEKLKPVEVSLRKIEELTDEINHEMEYLKKREERLRNTNESTNNRVKNFGILIIILLVSLSVWQLNYLQTYFKSKHIL